MTPNQSTTNDGIVYIYLTQDQTTVIDEADWPMVRQHRWYAVKSRSGGTFYAATEMGDPITGTRRIIQMQRFLLGEPNGKMVDHKSGDTLDNRRSNLRPATNSQNKANGAKYKNNRSGYKGVYPLPNGGWRAQVRHDRRLYELGCFQSAEDAARAYDAKARELHGAFARCNFLEN